MKTYETGEAIKILKTNRNRKFVDRQNRLLQNIWGEVVCTLNNEKSLIDVDEEWTLVPKLIDFRTAYEAYKKGNCIAREDNKKYFSMYKAIKREVEEGNLFSVKDIESKWFIKEDEDNE